MELDRNAFTLSLLDFYFLNEKKPAYGRHKKLILQFLIPWEDNLSKELPKKTKKAESYQGA